MPASDRSMDLRPLSERCNRHRLGLVDFAMVVRAMNITRYIQTFARYAMNGYTIRNCHRFALRRARA